jgi:hypothetical protein
VFIYWDNPFVWGSDTEAIKYSVTTTDVEPGCDADQGTWNVPSRAAGGTNPPGCTHELFGVSSQVNGVRGITWWDAAVNWPFMLGLTAFGEMDVHVEFTIGLRLKGSVAQTILATPCVGPQDIRTLSRTLGQPSLRKLFHM